MTLTHDTDVPRLHRRSELDLAAQQLQAIASFTTPSGWPRRRRGCSAQPRDAHGQHPCAGGHAARARGLIARAHEQLRLSGDLLHGTCERRIILAHRNEWFLDRLSRLLEASGWQVVARMDNGADAVGAAVAEQPELLLVEDTLAMVPGEQVVREVRQYCPQTVVAAQVAYSDRVGALLDAGASEVFTRKVPPADVAVRLLELAVA
jgi:CheY-like chemotaxis protein